MYMLHLHSQNCTGCGRTQHWSQLYHAEIQGTGQRLQPAKLVPLNEPIISVPLPTTATPLCSACLPADAATRGAAAAAAWEAAKQRKRHEAAHSTPTPAKPVRIHTLDELA